MKFRPCIDIHNGKVKQIVGGSLLDKGDYPKDNFMRKMSDKPAWRFRLIREDFKSEVG